MIRFLVAAILTMVCAAQAVAADTMSDTTSEMRFDVRFGPFRLAEIELRLRDDAQSYEAAGTVTSTATVRAVRAFHFDLSVQGRRDGTTFAPDRYVGDADTGRLQLQVEMRYANGVPAILSIAPDEPLQPWSLSAANQGGTVDPLTALSRIARAQSRDSLCDWSLDTFEGRRRGRISLDTAQEQGSAVVCDAAYSRIAGFSPDVLTESLSYPFSVRYQQDADGQWLLARIETQTPYGRMRILRRF